jgi:3-oxoacyl-[acyl-carrier-protein] synthase I
MSTDVVISAIGMVSSVGIGAAATCAAVRAGITMFAEFEDYCCELGERTFGPSTAPRPPEPVVGALAGFAERPPDVVPRMFLTAIQDMVQAAKLQRGALARIPIYASLPADLGAPRDLQLVRGFLADIQARSGFTFAPGSALLTRGHAGMFVAAEHAIASIARGERDACVIAGVESYFDVDTLGRLDREGRLKSQKNLDAFIPGECAAAVLIERRSEVERRGGAALAAVGAPGFGVEPSPLGSGDPSTAAGLCDAIEKACAATPGPIEWVICDLNGESYRANEWARARVRQISRLGGVKHLWHPADCLGDVGASTGGVLVALAAKAFERGYALASRALVFVASDDGARAALTITAP